MTDGIDDAAASPPRPLSPAQMPIWRAEVLRRHTPRWTQTTVVRLNGPVDPDALERAIAAIVARHPALRTRLQRRGGKAWQVVSAMAPFSLSRPAMPTQPDGGADAVASFLQATRHDRFDLYGGMLFQADLLVLAPDRSVLVLRLHHVAADGVALGLLVPQIAAAYRGDGIDPGPDRAYERWLDRQQTPPAGLEAASAHYHGELAGARLRSPALYDQPDGAEQREPPDLLEATRTLDQATCDRLRSLARARGATLFLVLFAAYAATVRQFADQDDLVIATFVSGRAGEPEPIIGSCINTVLVRLRLGDADSAFGLIDAVKQAWRPARKHQAVPMTLLSAADGTALPLAQCAINFLDMNETSFEAPGLSSSITHAQQGFPLNDLLLYALREQDDRLRLRLISGSGTGRLSQSRLDDMLDALARRLCDWGVGPYQRDDQPPA